MSEGVAGFGGGRGGGRWQILRTALNGRPGALQGGGIGLGELGWWAAMALRTALNGRPRVKQWGDSSALRTALNGRPRALMKGREGGEGWG